MAKPRPKLSEFRPQPRNANRHTSRGMALLERSMRRHGYSTPMVAAADGTVFDGSARLEDAAIVFGTDAEVQTVHTDGTRPVVLVRDDIPTADDPRAVELSVAANQISAENYDADVALLAEIAGQIPAVKELWTAEAWAELMAKAAVPNFEPVGVDEQGRLDEKAKTQCPECGHVFEPQPLKA